MPFQSLETEINKYKNASKITWCQEEHQNQGPYFYIEPRIRSTLKHVKSKCHEVEYAGRAPSASTATGLHKLHEKELKDFLKVAMS